MYSAAVPISAPVRRILKVPLAIYYGLDHLIRELMKFGVVGGVAYLIDTVLNNLLRQTPLLDDKPLTAKILSATAATVFAFAGNRYWTFRHRQDPGLARGFGLFALLNLVGLLIAVACLWFSHYVLGFTSLLADNIAGNIIGTGLGTLFRFWSYRKWVFKSVPEPVPAGAAIIPIPHQVAPASAWAESAGAPGPGTTLDHRL